MRYERERAARMSIRTYDVLEVGGAKYTPDRHRGSSLLGRRVITGMVDGTLFTEPVQQVVRMRC